MPDNDCGAFYTLHQHRERLIELPGLGEKLVDNLLTMIAARRHSSLARFVYALSIREVGEATAKSLAAHLVTLQRLMAASFEELQTVNDVGQVAARHIHDFFSVAAKRSLIACLRRFITIADGVPVQDNAETYVLTGTLQSMNRKAAAARLEALGAKVSSGLSGKTTALVAGKNPGSKLERARTLNVKVLDEPHFLAWLDEQEKAR